MTINFDELADRLFHGFIIASLELKWFVDNYDRRRSSTMFLDGRVLGWFYVTPDKQLVPKKS